MSTSGYGKRIEIQHANGYVTTYSHMSGFARGIVAGAHVVQGQVIGYLGQSGLATGPHLHYEVIINGNFVDPMAIKLARTREFDGKMLAAFKRERDRVDQLMAQAPNAAPAAARGRPRKSTEAHGESRRFDRFETQRGARLEGRIARLAQRAKRRRGGGSSTFWRPSRREPAGGGDSAAARRSSSACSSRCADVAAKRSRPRTTSLTPCSASSTTTAR